MRLKIFIILLSLFFSVGAQSQTKDEANQFFLGIKKLLADAEKSFDKDTTYLGKDLFLSELSISIMLKLGEFRGIVGDAWGKNIIPHEEKKKQKK